MKLVLVKTVFLLMIMAELSAQNQYFIVFKDKAGTSYSVDKANEFLSQRAILRRKAQNIPITNHDFPPNKTYLSQVSALGAKVKYKSKWMNGALIQCDPETLSKVKSLGFVKGVETNGEIKGLASLKNELNSKKSLDKFEHVFENFEYGNSKNQIEMIGIDKMHQNGFTGKGILIGILDSGFQNANKLSVFSKIFSENRIIDTYDFVDNQKSVYEDHNHGTNVLSCIGSNLSGSLIGTAPDASFVLLRTEDVNSETKIEEVNWLIGAEYADSVGVDVINSSLGYYSFDNPSQNYVYSDLDGNKTISARAADWAASKGILVVVSAGNEGNSVWGKISTPADADSILAVGAVNSLGNYASFSSQGPRNDGRIKPEIAAKGQGTTVASTSNTIVTSNGTSFSSPVIAGAVACLKQAFPTLKSEELRQIIIKSGSQYLNPDEFLGYGIPNFYTAYELANLEETLKSSGRLMTTYPNPVQKNSNLNIYLNDELLDGNAEVYIYNGLGKLMHQALKNGKLLNLSLDQIALGKGINYVKVVYNGNKSLVSKIIVY